MAKLAGSYAAYSSSATKLYKPRYPRFGMLQEKPTCLHREPAGENPPRDANGSTFPTNLGLELLGWILCTHPEAAVRSLCFILPHWRELCNLTGVVTRFVAEVCADILFNRDPFYCWAARAGSFPQHLHPTEVYRSLPLTPRRIVKHSLHTVCFPSFKSCDLESQPLKPHPTPMWFPDTHTLRCHSQHWDLLELEADPHNLI